MQITEDGSFFAQKKEPFNARLLGNAAVADGLRLDLNCVAAGVDAFQPGCMAHADMGETIRVISARETRKRRAKNIGVAMLRHAISDISPNANDRQILTAIGEESNHSATLHT